MSFPTYINFQVNNPGGGRSNMVVHSHAVILMLLSLCPESFGIFIVGIVHSFLITFKRLLFGSVFLLYISSTHSAVRNTQFLSSWDPQSSSAAGS